MLIQSPGYHHPLFRTVLQSTESVRGRGMACYTCLHLHVLLLLDGFRQMEELEIMALLAVQSLPDLHSLGVLGEGQAFNLFYLFFFFAHPLGFVRCEFNRGLCNVLDDSMEWTECLAKLPWNKKREYWKRIN
eukprot:scaffold14020_cov298-Ochromonas_danica.AAC.2